MPYVVKDGKNVVFKVSEAVYSYGLERIKIRVNRLLAVG